MPAQPPSATPVVRSDSGSAATHLDFIEGLRAILSLCVVLRHVEGWVWPLALLGGEEPPTWFRIATCWLTDGRWLVTMFIVISGYCLMLPPVKNGGYLKGGLRQFYSRRAKRILPPYYLGLAFVLLLIATLIGKKTGGIWDYCIPPTRAGLLVHVLLIQNWAPLFHPGYAETTVLMSQMATMTPEAMVKTTEKIMDVMSAQNNMNPPLWTVAAECQIYLCFPLLLWLWRRVGSLATVALSSLSYLYYIKHHTYLDTFVAPHSLWLFALGMLGAQITSGAEARWRRLRESRLWLPATLALVSLIAFLEVASKGFVSWVPWLMDLVVGPACVCFLIVLTKAGRRRGTAFLSSPKLVFLGTMSYSIYMLHVPLLAGVEQYLVPHFENKMLHFFVLAGPGGALVCAVSYVFYRFCERPFRNAAPRRAPRVALESVEPTVT
jgi:peptidoglycan/LPS O-acetylase OafA/YrhL